jgi:hypothetical protein
MPKLIATTNNNFGHQLVDSIAVQEATLNLLFAALLLGAFGIFIGGNVLLQDASILLRTARIASPCFLILCIFYALSRSIGNVTWGLTLTYSLMWIVTYSRLEWLIPTIYVMGALALAYTIKFMRVERREWQSLALMAVIMCATVLGFMRGYTTFDILERLRRYGTFSSDTLFHASIAAMIKNYGVASTGLHGLIETPYHVLSHALFANVSLLSGVGVLEVYGVASWVLFAPLLIFCAVTICVKLDKSDQLNVQLVWSVICVLLVISPIALRKWAVWDSFFLSESYLVSLGLFLLGLSQLFKRRLGIPDLLLVLVLTTLMSNAKASVGLTFAGLWLTRVLFTRDKNVAIELLAALIAIFSTIWVMFDSAKATAGAIVIEPLAFIKEYSFLGGSLADVFGAASTGQMLTWRSFSLAFCAIFSFVIFHFFFSWLLLAHALLKRNLAILLKLPIVAYSLAAILSGLLIVSVFNIPGGSAFYFTNVAFFVSLPGVAVLSTKWIDRLPASRILFPIAAVIVVLVLNKNVFQANSRWHSIQPIQYDNGFIDSLIALRHATPINIIIKADKSAFATTPVAHCVAEPFIFSAISERPWVDILPNRVGCTYQYYGYSQYGITELVQHVTVQPRLLKNMKTLSWSSTSIGYQIDGQK